MDNEVLGAEITEEILRRYTYYFELSPWLFTCASFVKKIKK